MTTVKFCLGSSCYVRGNDKTLAFLEKYIRENKKDISIEVVGCRCRNLCQEGPNIYINDEKYHYTTPEDLIKTIEAL